MARYKEIFLIHTKSSQISCTLVEGCSHLLCKSGYSVWDYRDWEWSPDEIVYRSDVSDIEAFARGDPEAFRHEVPGDVDRETLMKILKDARLVAVVVPEDGHVTSGVAEELRLIKEVQPSYKHALERPTLLCCTFQKNASLPDRIRDLNFAGYLSFEPAAVTDSVSWGHHLACRIAHLLLLQVIASVRASNDIEFDIELGTIERRLNLEINRAKTLHSMLVNVRRDEEFELLAQIRAAESLSAFFSYQTRKLDIDTPA